MPSTIRLIAAFAAAILLPVAAVAQTPAAPTNAAAPPVIGAPPSGSPITAPTGEGAQEYILGPEDVVEYSVVGTADKTRVRVYSDGTMQTSFGGRIQAAGKTPRQLAADIANVLKTGGYYANPVVDVEVVGYASRYVTVLGAVGSPGLVPINRPYRLSEILARVGGARGEAADYLIVRPESGDEKRYSIDKLAAGGADQDPYVTAGEKIFIPVAELFYISGQVKQPGAYPVRTDMSVAQAIARAGGLTESGSEKKVKVRRGTDQISLKGEDKIEAGDVLTVGERLF